MPSSNTNSSFEKNYSRIIHDAYEHGEFDPPSVTHTGDVIDILDMEQPSGSDIVHRKFGDTTLKEVYLPDGMRITQLNDGEVNMVEDVDQSRITTRKGDNTFEVTGSEGETRRIVADDTPIELNFNLPKIEKVIEEFRKGDDNSQSPE